jgi:hypothetical protein
MQTLPLISLFLAKLCRILCGIIMLNIQVFQFWLDQYYILNISSHNLQYGGLTFLPCDGLCKFIALRVISIKEVSV